MNATPTLHYRTSIPLKHREDCSLLGVTPDYRIYVEEVYTPDAWVAQHCVTLDGQFVESIDEEYGEKAVSGPLEVPQDAIRPIRGWRTNSLNFAGPRQRGLRELERVQDVVKPIPVQAKIALSQQPGVEIAPMQLLGVAESYVLAEIELARPNLYIVCRRMRLAYALPQVETDERGAPYDYDTRVIYLAHFHQQNHDDEHLLTNGLESLPGVTLHRPMDCLLCGDFVFVADGSNGDQVSHIHVWNVKWPAATDSEDALYDLRG
ncbi:MAG: hypothetical protein SF029_23345 [bacterium]|nr:hypothetical protein [bacterium]